MLAVKKEENMSKVCPMISTVNELKDCIKEECALWMDISISSGKRFIGCAFLINAEKKLSEEKNNINWG